MNDTLTLIAFGVWAFVVLAVICMCYIAYKNHGPQ